MPRFSTRLFLSAVLAATTGSTSAVQAAEPIETPEQTIQTTLDSVEQVFSQPASFTQQMTEAGICGTGTCGAGCGAAGCQSDGDCDGLNWLQTALDRPLLADYQNMPIGDCWTASVGGQLRYRFMDENNRLRPGGPGRSTYDLWRITPYMQLKYGDSITGYVQAIDASIFNQELPITPIDQNRSDLMAYYIDAVIGETDTGKLHVRVGRQQLQYGSQYLVSPLPWANTFRTWDGIRLYYTSDTWDIDGFWTRPSNSGAGALFRPTSFDQPDSSRNFSGIYSTYKGLANATLDLYWLYLEESESKNGILDGRVHTFGSRYTSKTAVKDCCGETVGTWAFELEGAFQVGSNETFLGNPNQGIAAGMVHTNLGYTWNQAPWTPNVKGVFYWASGDSNPADGTNRNFNTLFPFGHAYWGILDNLNGSNLLNYSLQATVKPTDKLTFNTQLHWFAKDKAASPIFNVAGAPFPAGASTTSSTYIGSELDLIATYQISKTLQVQSGYSWFWYGSAVNNAAAPLPRGDASQFYVMTTWTF